MNKNISPELKEIAKEFLEYSTELSPEDQQKLWFWWGELVYAEDKIGEFSEKLDKLDSSMDRLEASIRITERKADRSIADMWNSLI